MFSFPLFALYKEKIPSYSTFSILAVLFLSRVVAVGVLPEYSRLTSLLSFGKLQVKLVVSGLSLIETLMSLGVRSVLYCCG